MTPKNHIIPRCNMSKKTSRTIIVFCAVAALLLFAFFLKDILVPLIKLEIGNDVEGAKKLLLSKGLLGCAIVPLVEALQMIVIFIPAEFIQISSGLSYPFPVALLLCDLGVCLGASLIFLFVRTFRFQNDTYDKSKKEIEQLEKKGSKSTVLLMLLLFIMPLIPFGAICYYGSGSKVRYRQYILTVAGGVVPSIATSNLMGKAARAFIIKAIPLWLLILIIVLLGAVLFTVLAFFLNRYYFKESDGTPDSPVCSLMFRIAGFLWKRKLDVTVDNGLPEDIKPPYVLLANHHCFYDFYIASFLDPDRRAAYVANEYYLKMNAVFRFFSKKIGFIPKKLFTSDFVTPAGIFRAVRKGYPVTVFPEGRLSVDGNANPIIERSAAFYRKLGVPLVIMRISGAYFCKPKWRARAFRSKVRLNVERAIRPEEFAKYTDEELNAIIEDALSFDASDNLCGNVYKGRQRARGLETILYRCADCGSLYTTKGVGNSLVCSSCGAKRTLNEVYRFEDICGCREGSGIKTISDYYKAIKARETGEIGGLELKTEVRVKHFDKNVRLKRRERGICTLTPEKFEYASEDTSFSIPTEKLPALPFSCGEEFETYHDDELFYFYPAENRNQVARWALLVDIMKELRDRK